jgi:hypothetical protein
MNNLAVFDPVKTGQLGSLNYRIECRLALIGALI